MANEDLTFDIPVRLRISLTQKALRNLPRQTVIDTLISAIGDQLDPARLNDFIRSAIIRKETFQGDEIECYELTINSAGVVPVTRQDEENEEDT